MRQSIEKRRAEKAQDPSRPPASTDQWTRKAAYEFTGCISHVEVTEHSETGTVSRIIGILTHNEECVSAELKRRPAIHLHEHVYEVAIEQLLGGARFGLNNMCNHRLLIPVILAYQR